MPRSSADVERDDFAGSLRRTACIAPLRMDCEPSAMPVETRPGIGAYKNNTDKNVSISPA